MRLAALSVLTLIFVNASPARAAESYDSCTGFVDSVPAVISTQGTWCLRGDLSTALGTGAAIVINTNNVTLDCNRFKLGGLAAGAGTQASGILASERLNATVRNCNIRGFYRGVEINGGSGHVIEDSRFEANTHIGISMVSDNSLVRGNHVIDTGGSSANSIQSFGMLLFAADGHATDNTISGLTTLDPTGATYGIYFFSGAGGTVRGNAVTGLDPSITGYPRGIYATGAVLVQDNFLQGPLNNPNSVGVFCQDLNSMARDNTLSTWDLDILDCFSSGNLINPN